MMLEARLGGSVLGQYHLLFSFINMRLCPMNIEALYQTVLLLEIHFLKWILLLQVGERWKVPLSWAHQIH